MSSSRRKSSLQTNSRPDKKTSADGNIITKARRTPSETEPSTQNSSRNTKARSTVSSPSTPVSPRAPSLKLPEELFRAGWTSLDEEWWPSKESLEATRNRQVDFSWCRFALIRLRLASLCQSSCSELKSVCQSWMGIHGQGVMALQLVPRCHHKQAGRSLEASRPCL